MCSQRFRASSSSETPYQAFLFLEMSSSFSRATVCEFRTDDRLETRLVACFVGGGGRWSGHHLFQSRLGRTINRALVTPLSGSSFRRICDSH